MDENLKVYNLIVDAIKVSEANNDLEKDFRDIEIDKETLETKLINDTEIQEKALKKVISDGNQRK